MSVWGIFEKEAIFACNVSSSTESNASNTAGHGGHGPDGGPAGGAGDDSGNDNNVREINASPGFKRTVRTKAGDVFNKTNIHYEGPGTKDSEEVKGSDRWNGDFFDLTRGKNDVAQNAFGQNYNVNDPGLFNRGIATINNAFNIGLPSLLTAAFAPGLMPMMPFVEAGYDMYQGKPGDAMATLAGMGIGKMGVKTLGGAIMRDVVAPAGLDIVADQINNMDNPGAPSSPSNSMNETLANSFSGSGTNQGQAPQQVAQQPTNLASLYNSYSPYQRGRV